MEPDPFAYPKKPHVRKHGPFGYTNYQDYRPWLRDEFIFRCVFCLYREQWPSTQTFEIDHLLPRSKYPEGECDYDNLLYPCPRCNGNKRAKLVPDPCRVALGTCLRVYADGRITARNRSGRLLVKILRLDNAAYTRMRQQMLQILKSCARGDRKLFVSATGWTPVQIPGGGPVLCLNPWCRIYIRVVATTWRPIIFQIAARNVSNEQFPLQPAPDGGPNPNDFSLGPTGDGVGTMMIMTTRATQEFTEDINGDAVVGIPDFNMWRSRQGAVSQDLTPTN